MSRHVRLYLIAGLLSLVGLASAAEPESCRVVAHRGLLLHAPENTLANFRACLELRLGFEMDVQRSQDGQLVCVHDDSVDRTTNGTGRVQDLTLQQLRSLDAGSWFSSGFRGEPLPTVAEVFQTLARYPHRVLVAVDLKAADVEHDVVRLARQHQVLDRLLFIGRTISEPAVRQQLKQADPQTAVAILVSQTSELTAAIQDMTAQWVCVRFVPSREEVAQVHQAGKHLFIAGPTVAAEQKDNWRRCLANGVDAILTDYPLSLAQVVRVTRGTPVDRRQNTRQ